MYRQPNLTVLYFSMQQLTVLRDIERKIAVSILRLVWERILCRKYATKIWRAMLFQSLATLRLICHTTKSSADIVCLDTLVGTLGDVDTTHKHTSLEWRAPIEAQSHSDSECKTRRKRTYLISPNVFWIIAGQSWCWLRTQRAPTGANGKCLVQIWHVNGRFVVTGAPRRVNYQKSGR